MIIKQNGDLLHICGFLSCKKAIFALLKNLMQAL